MSTIGIVGLHALPNSHGGYEQYFSYVADNSLFCDFAKENIVNFYCRSDYASTPDGLNFVPVVPSKGESGWRYYVEAINKASKECDFIYCCGTGSSIGLLLRLPTLYRRGVKIAINVDGEEHKRTKYNVAQRWIILGLHLLSMLLAHIIVLDSKSLAGRLPLAGLFERKLAYLPYFFPDKLKLDITGPKEPGLDNYDLVVARLVPENNLELMINAKIACNDSVPLLIIGDAGDEYGKYLTSRYSSEVQFLGGIYDQNKLNNLRRNCRNYIHGHSVGGTNPSLIEALGLCSTIFAFKTPYNEEAAGSCAKYFATESELANLFQIPNSSTNDKETQIQAFSEERGIAALIHTLKNPLSSDRVRSRHSQF